MWFYSKQLFEIRPESYKNNIIFQRKLVVINIIYSYVDIIIQHFGEFVTITTDILLLKMAIV